MQTLLKDIQYGLRMLLKYRLVSIIAIITLALGIGANSAIFSLVNAVLLKPLPYEQPENLVFISEKSSQLENMSISYPNFVDWKEQNRVFEAIGVFRSQNSTLTGVGEPEYIKGVQCSQEVFSILRVKPIIGRVFLPEDDKPGATPVILLSYGLWQQKFGGQNNVLTSSITIDGRSYNVIGVMPATFKFPFRQTQVWVPVGLSASDPNWTRDNHPGLYAIARLKHSINLKQAQTEMDNIATQLEKQYPTTNPDNKVAMNYLYEKTVKEVKTAILFLLACVGAVLLIACANVANLMLARSTARSKEIAIRAVLGANSLTIIRQLLTESMLLALSGGVLGLIFASWCVNAIVSFPGLENVPRLLDIKIDNNVLLFTFGVSTLTGVLFGSFPALQASRLDLNESLKETGRTTTISTHQQQVRNILVITEVAVTLILLISAGLFIKSFVKLQNVDTGFETKNVLMASMNIPQTKYVEREQLINFHQEVITKLSNLSGVESVATASRLPLQSKGNQTFFLPEGFSGNEANLPVTEFTIVSPDYFGTLGIKLIKGRSFNEQDTKDSLPVAIVDEKFAKYCWPDQDPIGKKVKGGKDPNNPWVTVVGVVASIRYDELTAEDSLIQMYRSCYQIPSRKINLAVKTIGEPTSLINVIRTEVLTIDKDQAVYDIQKMSLLLEETVAPEKLMLVLLGLFALIAITLASVGIYGVMSYFVSQRTHEIGIRMALGAQTQELMKMVIKQGMTVTLIGIGLGLIGAVALSQIMGSLLYQVSTTDVATFVIASVFLLLVSFLACYFPARKATKVDPLEALRHE